MTWQAVIFDMDGVLVDSEPLHHQTTNVVLGRRGVHLDEEAYEAYKGLTDGEFFDRLVKRFGLQEPGSVLARERLGEFLLLGSQGPLVPNDGALECLLTLRADGRRLALASSSVREQVELVVEKLGLRRVLEVRVSGDQVAAGKPAPDLFLEAARRLRAEPAECLVVEDAVLGVQAARAAGMAAVALIGPEGDGAGHLAAGALRCLKSLRELTPEALDEWVP